MVESKDVRTIVYYSIAGNTKAFANKFKSEGYNVLSVQEADNVIEEPFVIFCPTYNFGKVPVKAEKFIEKYKNLLKGVVGFGHINWGKDFCKAGVTISSNYHVPLLGKIVVRGTDEDFISIKERLSGGIQEVAY